jgi:hypothetical protein
MLIFSSLAKGIIALSGRFPCVFYSMKESSATFMLHGFILCARHIYFSILKEKEVPCDLRLLVYFF